MERIVGFDPAASTGYAIIEITNNRAIITEYGHFDLQKGEFRGDTLLNLHEQIESLLERIQPNHIVFEDYHFNPRQMAGCTTNIAYRAIIELIARTRKITYSALPVTGWKKGITGRVNPTKEQNAKWGKEAKKVMIQEALWNNHQIRFPNHSLSEKTGKPIKFRYDEVDVVGQLVHFVCSERGVNKVSSKVPVPADVEIKSEWKCFEYQ